MTHPESYGKELAPTDLDGKLRERFTTLLQNTADHLEFMTTPDELVYEVRHIAFGRSNKESISLSHTNDHGYHYGKVAYTHTGGLDAQDNSRRSFIFDNTLQDGNLWTSGQRHFSSYHVLRKLARNWPIGANSEWLEELLAKAAPVDDDHPPREVPVKEVLELLEQYALQYQTGDVEYERSWRYTDATYNTDSFATRATALDFTVIRDEFTDLRQIRAELTVPYVVDEVPTLLTYHAHSDEIGDLLVNATYRHPIKKDVDCSVPIKNHSACYTELERVTNQLVAEKMAIADTLE